MEREGTWSGSPETRPAHIVVEAAAPRNDAHGRLPKVGGQLTRDAAGATDIQPPRS